jgi:hypothetical protein
MWGKKKFIHNSDGRYGWDSHSFMVPLLHQKKSGELLVFGSPRDSNGIARIAKLRLEDSFDAAGYHELALDLGEPGCFDDNGVMPGCIFEYNGRWFMYYMGFQLVDKIKFYAFTGLLESNDDGENWIRRSKTPVLDRSDNGLFVRAIYDIVKLGNQKWRIFYSAASRWEVINGVNYGPTEIFYADVDNPLDLSGVTGIKLPFTDDFNYRVGHPKVSLNQTTGVYEMYCNSDNVNKEYSYRKFTSSDLSTWVEVEKDLPPGENNEWDGLMLTYPAVYNINDNRIVLYNGNDMGREGFGILVEE